MDECKKGGVCNWVEEYYGWRCTKCGGFYPYDHAPWDEDEDGNAIADEPFPFDEEE
jgi:hypothetical protein